MCYLLAKANLMSDALQVLILDPEHTHTHTHTHTSTHTHKHTHKHKLPDRVFCMTQTFNLFLYVENIAAGELEYL